MTTPSLSPSCKVNVRLCGSVPRGEIDSLSLLRCAPLVLQTSSLRASYLEQVALPIERHETICLDHSNRVAAELCSQLCNLEDRSERLASRKPHYEAPGWAVPASGEARLEPVFDSVNRQPPIDLTEKAIFRIGRSPSSDVQLLHATSSRKHAMLFHHKNGACYIIDCNSAHGTYVNGVRITSLPNDGVVIPHKVKRGSIVRFGGPGAPTFMLKSFSFGLEEMRDYESSIHSALSPTSAVNLEVEHNTRFNSLGATARNSLIMSLSSKRSFDSMSTVEDEEYEESKRRCSSPPMSPQHPMRLVSPDFSQPGQKRRRVSFSSAPPKAFYPNLVSPDISSDENETEENI